MHSATVIVSSGISIAALLLIAGLGELVAERAGTLNISVEAMMLAGAFAAGMSAHATGSVLVGMITGCGAGLVLGLIQANLSHRASVDQFVVGLVLVILVQGVTTFLIGTTKLNVVPRGSTWSIPGLSAIPVVGKSLFAEPWPFYGLYVMLPLIWALLYRTRWGLEVRSVGEDPTSAMMTGVPVQRRRRAAVSLCGLLSGYAGAMLAVAIVGAVSQDMTAGIGYIAIAAVLLGGWSILGTLLSCVLFGMVNGLALALPALGVQANSQLLAAAPYLVVIATAPAVAWRRQQPAALGLPL